MNGIQKLARGSIFSAVTGAVPLAQIRRAAGQAAKKPAAQMPKGVKAVSKVPRPASKAGPSGAAGYIAAPKLLPGAMKNITLQQAAPSVAAYQQMPKQLRQAVESSDLVRAGMPPATALALAQASMQKATRKGVASGLPENLSTTLQKYMGTPAASRAAPRMPTGMSQVVTGAQSPLAKTGSVHWNAFVNELMQVMEAA